MRIFDRRPGRLCPAVAGSLLSLAIATSGGATTLDLIDGTSDSVGPLTFNWTKAEETPSGAVDLSQIDLVTTSDAQGFGFDLVFQPGALAANDDGPRDIKLVFTVTSTMGIETVGNHLSATATNNGSVSVSELIEEAPAVDVGVVEHGMFSMPSATEMLPAGLTELTIVKNIVATATSGGTAEAILLQQRYVVIPEPATAALLLLGLSGMSIAHRRFVGHARGSGK